MKQKENNLFTFPLITRLGYISRLHGYKGHVKVVLQRKLKNKVVVNFLFIEYNARFVPYTVKSLNDTGGEAIILFEDVNDEDSAKKITGKEIFIEEKFLIKKDNALDENSIVGFMIIDEKENEIGKVGAVLNYNQKLIQTFINDKEILLPLNEETLLKTEAKTKVIQLKIPEGLIEFYLE